MNIHRITGPPSLEMSAALASFEKEFQYPLGQGRTFSISHGSDYSRFFRSMGEVKIYVAEIGGKILGALAAVARTVVLADGSMISAAYICDVKVVSAHRGSVVLGRLAVRARDEIVTDGCHSAYSIVMSGSPPPDQYTGRLGIPHFRKIGELIILRFDTHARFDDFETPRQIALESLHRVRGADPSICSGITPILLDVNGASGRIVDTRNGKRLWRSDGSELTSAHLVDVQSPSASSLAALVKAAVARAGECGFPGLFLALPATTEFPRTIVKEFIETSVTRSEAAVYGTGIPAGNWMINSSEI